MSIYGQWDAEDRVKVLEAALLEAAGNIEDESVREHFIAIANESWGNGAL